MSFQKKHKFFVALPHYLFYWQETLLRKRSPPSVTSPAATAFCASNPKVYRSQWTWGSGVGNPPPNTVLSTTDAVVAPTGAPNVLPSIQQFRNGTVIATYTSFSGDPSTCTYKGDGTDWQNPSYAASTGCGPFSRYYAFRLWAPGDIFVVAPTIYTGVYNQPYFGPQLDGYSSTTPTPMSNITVQGAIVSNYRPVIYYNPTAADFTPGSFNLYNTLDQSAVYIGVNSNLSWSNIDVFAGPGVESSATLDNNVLQAGVYVNGAANLSFSNSRISGFENTNYSYYLSQINAGGSAEVGANGFQAATGSNSGTMTLTSVELDHNGGLISNYAHNAYISDSTADPNFTVKLVNSWSHDAWQGHLFKSRAAKTIVIGNYFQGGLPQNSPSLNSSQALIPNQAEAYLLDVPNGGTLTAYTNIFVKNASGANSNGVSIEYGSDGPLSTTETQSIDIESNTFAAFSATFDGVNTIYPFLLFGNTPPTPGVPGSSSFPTSTAVNIQGNLFAGYCPSGQPLPNIVDYLGNLSASDALSDLNLLWVPATNYTFVGTDSALGSPKYWHVVTTKGNLTTNRVGAE